MSAASCLSHRTSGNWTSCHCRPTAYITMVMYAVADLSAAVPEVRRQSRSARGHWGGRVHPTFVWGCSWDWCRSGVFFRREGIGGWPGLKFGPWTPLGSPPAWGSASVVHLTTPLVSVMVMTLQRQADLRMSAVRAQFSDKAAEFSKSAPFRSGNNSVKSSILPTRCC